MISLSISLRDLYRDLERSMTALRSDSTAVTESRAIVDKVLESDQSYYGINTGFGILAGKRIDKDQLEQLQRNLILSHAVGVGDLVSKHLCRLILHLKIHSLGLGYSGVSPTTFNRLLLFAERDLIPAIPCKGSVGASGDLAPLAHLALPLLGHGLFWDEQGSKAISASHILRNEGLEPIELQPKDGLCLINGTQLMSSYGAYILEKTIWLCKMADLLAAMSLEALQGSIGPFDARLHQLRPHPGQRAVADNVRKLLTNSEILESHRNCEKVQDPYSLRCVPQVHGASRDALGHAIGVVEREINSVTDNPLVFANGDVLSGGNFHGQPIALSLDYAAMALAELASISERRTYLLLEGHDGLPRLLMRETGINSGFMVPQYTAAALVSENKVLCHPASVDSIPTSLGQEDHVSMGSISALKLLEVFQNVEQVLAIEMLTAAQALDFRQPLRPGRGVELTHEFIRAHVAHRESDAYFGDDLARCAKLVHDGELEEIIEKAVGRLN